jgi:hypothetical protein
MGEYREDELSHSPVILFSSEALFLSLCSISLQMTLRMEVETELDYHRPFAKATLNHLGLTDIWNN